MSRLRYTACEALRQRLEPQLVANNVESETLPSPPDRVTDYPALRVIPGRPPEWEYNALYSIEACDENGDVITAPDGRPLYLVGEFVGPVDLWKAARYPFTREIIDDIVNSAFHQTGTPGRLTVTDVPVEVVNVLLPYTVDITFRMDTNGWDEEKVFEDRRWALLRTYVNIPIYVLRDIIDGNNTILTDLQICITQDITTEIPPGTDPADALELIQPVESRTVPL